MADWTQMAKSDLSSATTCANVTPSDTVDLRADGRPCRAISIGTAGDLEIITLAGDTVVIPANCLAVGIPHPVFATRILAANTTALEIVAWF